jgi:two-component system response regulator HydG
LHIAVFDEDYLARQALKGWLVPAGHRVSMLDVGELNEAALKRLKPDLVLLDSDSRRVGVTRFVAALREILPGSCVVVMTSRSTMARAMRAVEDGAFDFIERPLMLENVNAVLRKAQRHLELAEENRDLHLKLARQDAPAELIGRNHEIERLQALVALLATSELPVLISGEPGTGKTLLARVLHSRAGGRDEDFVEVDCQCLQGDLLARFLVERLLEAQPRAAEGSPRPVTACFEGLEHLSEPNRRLLRALAETRRLTDPRTGRACEIQARLVSTTCLSLEELAERPGLTGKALAQVGVVRLHLPPLRARGLDVLLLAEHFRERANRACGAAATGFDQRARAALLACSWPGNVRELASAVEAAVALARRGEVGLEHLPSCARGPQADGRAASEPRSLAEVEREHILATLEAVHGNKAQAARLLGINRMTLYKKLERAKAQVSSGEV